MEATIEIALITTNKQPTEEDHVQEFVELLEAGHRFAPVTVRAIGGGYRLVDGRHRTEAHRRMGHTTIRARVTL